MLSLELKLSQDASGHFKNQIKRSLFAELNRIETELVNGVSPDRYGALSNYGKSIRTANEIVDLVWEVRQRKM